MYIVLQYYPLHDWGPPWIPKPRNLRIKVVKLGIPLRGTIFVFINFEQGFL